MLARVLADYRAVAKTSRDYYVLHEELETFNAPCYFLELVERAGEHGLAYLAEAQPQMMFADNYGDKVAEPLLKECGHSQMLLEQYLDFVVNRTFRQSLLVHAERASQISYQLDRSRYGRLHFAAWMPPVDGETRLDDTRQEYGEPDGPTLFTQDPGVKAALDALNARWPWTLSRPELLDAAQARLRAAGIECAANQQDSIDDLLELLIVRGQARYRLDPVLPEPFVHAAAAGRTGQADGGTDHAGMPTAFTFNPWHETLLLYRLDRHLLPLLDGTRDRDALVEALLAIARQDLISFERDGERLSAEAELRDAATEFVDELPQRLAGMKLLRANDDAEAGR